MQSTGTFFDMLFGPEWTAQGVAVVVASVVALTAAVITAIVAIVQGNRTRTHAVVLDESQADRDREFKAREHWWDRFSWAVSEPTGNPDQHFDMAVIVLGSLSKAPWVRKDEKSLVAEAYLVLLSRVVPEKRADG